MTRVRNSSFRERRETVIGDTELSEALEQSKALDNEYFRLRALAVLSLLRLSGARVNKTPFAEKHRTRSTMGILITLYELTEQMKQAFQ